MDKTPSNSVVHKEADGECDCFECTQHSEASNHVNETMNRDESIVAILKNTDISVERAMEITDIFIDLGIVDYPGS